VAARLPDFFESSKNTRRDSTSVAHISRRPARARARARERERERERGREREREREREEGRMNEAVLKVKCFAGFPIFLFLFFPPFFSLSFFFFFMRAESAPAIF